MAEFKKTEFVKKNSADFGAEIASKETRKLNARKENPQSIYMGFGVFGLIGWSVVLPTLLGALLGIWIDERFAGSRSYTLIFLLAGLLLGCLNAANWIAKENKKIHATRNDKHD